MKVALLGLIGCVLVFYMGQGILLLYRLQRGKSLAATARPVEQLRSTAEMHVLFLGDSTVVGTGVRDTSRSTVGRFITEYPSASVENLGKNGLKIAGVEEQLADAKRERYDLLVLQVGGNDIVFWTELSEIEDEIQRLVPLLLERADSVVLLHSGNVGLTPAFPKGLGLVRYYEERTRSVRSAYQQVAEHYPSVYYVDLFYDRTSDEKWDLSYYAEDRFHPNDKGYGSWYDRISPVVSEALK